MIKNQQIVSVIGLGKAGLPLTAVMAKNDIQVLGVDIDDSRCKLINNGGNPIPEEPGLSELLSKYGGNKIKATINAENAAKQANVHIVIVPVFIDDQKNPDYKYTDQAFTAIATGLKKDDLVVLETTVPPQTTETRFKRILENGSKLKAGIDFHLAYSPERIMVGYSISRYTEFPKVVGGLTKTCGEKACKFYQQFAKTVHTVTNCKTAELIKVAEGMYRDTNIALANELKIGCDKLGINFDEIRDKANHEFCHIHQSGLGVGGHCIPVYPWFFIKEMQKNNLKADLSKTARTVNDNMIYFWKDKLLSKLKKINKPQIKIGVLGINFRSGVKELAYTRTIPFIKVLIQNNLDVYVKDKFWNKQEIEKLGFKYLDDSINCDFIVILNKKDFPEYKEKSNVLII